MTAAACCIRRCAAKGLRHRPWARSPGPRSRGTGPEKTQIWYTPWYIMDHMKNVEKWGGVNEGNRGGNREERGGKQGKTGGIEENRGGNEEKQGMAPRNREWLVKGHVHLSISFFLYHAAFHVHHRPHTMPDDFSCLQWHFAC